jgi:hypothetical protein
VHVTVVHLKTAVKGLILFNPAVETCAVCLLGELSTLLKSAENYPNLTLHWFIFLRWNIECQCSLKQIRRVELSYC